MKKYFTSLAFFGLTVLKGQVFAPINTASYNIDAVAENTTAMATTAGAIDGSNYVLYSAAYGALYNVSTGLPNNGLISSGTRTYQLQPYTQNNILYVTAGQSDTITFVNPAAYAGLSLLGFATEGTGTFNATLRFTDNTTQVFSSQTYPDWFNTGSIVISGFDRATRNTGNPANSAGNPRMFNLDLGISCANRSKSVQRLIIQNTGTNARICIMAVSGANAPVFTATSTPVTCSGGTNGSALITASLGIQPYTYTWSTTPPQFAAQAVSLPVGVYTYSAQDNGGCVVTNTVAVTQSLVPQPPLTVSSNIYTICSGGTFTMGASGAFTYTWAGNNTGSIYSPGPVTVNTTTVIHYSVSGLTTANCLLTGSINITVHPLPQASFTSAIGPLCKNSGAISLSNFVGQTGGTFSGQSVVSGSFNPLSTGTFVITYLRTDANNCSNSATTSVQVFSLAAPAISALTAQCANAPTIQAIASPTGGIFGGSQGISSAGVITPSAMTVGNNGVSYSITVGPCTSTAGTSILINGVPSASIISPKTFYCKTTNPFSFNVSPFGGTFTGPGMTGSTFNPSKANIGNNNIVVYSFTDGNGCTDTASVRLTVSDCAGITEALPLNTVIGIYPNPSAGKLSISAKEPCNLHLVNQIGQLISRLELKAENNYELQIEGLAEGVYFISAEHRSGSIKVVVSK
jgi:hypothetical protein